MRRQFSAHLETNLDDPTGNSTNPVSQLDSTYYPHHPRSAPKATTFCKYALAAFGLVIGVTALSSCKSDKPEKALRELTLGLSWVHQAQFSGEYYADRHGLYAKEGLRVTFVPATIDKGPVEQFLAGKYDFVIAEPDSLINARVKGHKVKAIAATFRVHPQVFIALKSSGIDEPQDFRGKKIGVTYSDELILKAMLRKASIDPSEVTIVKREYNLDSLTSGAVDVQGAWLTNEVQTARSAGLSLNIISPYDYGVTFYADVLIGRESLLESEPELVERFVRATMEGWNQALQNPDEHGKLALHYNPELKAEHEVQLLNVSAPLIHTGTGQIGWMQAAVWADMVQALYDQGVIAEKPEASTVFTTRFLQPTYPAQ